MHGIAAASHREAADLARERFDLDRVRASACFDAFHEFTVHSEGDARRHESKRFTGSLEELTG
jgi:hypothetical protein